MDQLFTVFLLHKKIITRWLVYWLSVFGIYVLILKPNGINYLNGYYYTSALFFLGGVFGLILFRFKFKKEMFFQSSFGVFTVIFLYSFMALGFDYLYPASPELLSFTFKNNILFPLFNYQTIISKACDIFFQQTLIYILTMLLFSKIQDKSLTIKLFGLCFFILHLPLLFVFGATGLLFIVPSIVAGLVFSFCLLQFKMGILYSYAIHFSFYLFLGIILRFYF